MARAAEMAAPTSMVPALSWLPGHRRPMQRDGRPEEDAYIDTDLGDEGGGDHPVDARDLHQQGVLNAVTCELCFDAVVECGDILLGRFETAQLCRQ